MKKKVFIIFITTGIILYLVFFNNKKYVVKNQQVFNCENCLVKNEEKAIEIAEKVLFEYYGESKIKKERPYNIILVNNKLWVITGSLNKGIFDYLLFGNIPKFGGTFEIKIDAKTARIIEIMHYK